MNSELTCHISILVLREGRIVEQGKYSELIERGGAFATMHRDQALVHPEAKQELSPYSVEMSPGDSPIGTKDQPTYAAGVVEPSAIAIFPMSSDLTTADKAGIVAFPTSGDDQSSVVSPETPQDTPAPAPQAVTFDDSVHSSRVGSPDPDSEPKRKMISSQNFQRLARRISVSGRRQGSTSSILPALLKRDSQTAKTGSAVDSPPVESPTSSLWGEDKGKKAKEKRKSLNVK